MINILSSFSHVLGTLPPIDDIIKYVNIGLIAAFAAVLAFAALGFIRGLFRGWKRGTYRLIFFAIIIAASVLLLKPISGWVGNTNAVPFIGNSFDFTYNNVTYTVTVGTFYDTAKNFFYIFMHDCLKVAAPPTKILEYAVALGSSSISFALMLVFGILHIFLGNLFCWLLWHLIFKRFTPKPLRKVKKGRLLSAFEHLIVTVCCMAMVVTPLSATLGTLRELKDVKTTSIKNEDAKQLVEYAQKISEAYDNSLFAKTFFNWSLSDGTETYDQAFVSFVTQATYGDVTTDFLSQVSQIVDLGTKIVNSGILSYYGAEGIEWAAALNSEAIPAILRALCATDIVQIALPLGVAIALGLDQVKDYLDQATIDYLLSDDIDWTANLEDLSVIYDDLIASGIFSIIQEGSSQAPKFTYGAIYTLIDDGAVDDEHPYSYGAFHSILDSEFFDLLNRVLTGALYTYAQKEDASAKFKVSDFLPKKPDGTIDYNEMVNTDWMDEIALVYDALYELNLIDRTAVKSIFDQLDSLAEPTSLINVGGDLTSIDNAVKDESSSASSSAGKSIDFKPLLEMAVSHPLEIADILAGDEDSLFDSKLLANYLPKLLPLLQDTLNPSLESSGIQLDLTVAANALYDEDRAVMVDNYKDEVYGLLANVAGFVQTDIAKEFLLDIGNHPGIVMDGTNLKYIDPELTSGLIDLLRGMDNSVILNSTLPGIFKAYLSGDKNPLASYGVTLCFDVDGIGSEMAYILGIIENCPTLLGDFMTATGSGMDFNAVADLIMASEDEFVYLLDALASSNIINPVIDGKYNANFTKLLNTALGTSGISIPEGLLDNIDLCNTMINQGEYIYIDGEPVYDGETGALVRILVELGSSGVLTKISSLSGASTTEAMEILSKIDIRSLFAEVDNSLIFSNALPGILDGAFLQFLQVPTSLEQDITFKNVTSWAAEGNALATLIEVAVNGFDLANLDFFSGNLDMDAVSLLLGSLADSGIFKKYNESTQTYDYKFPEYVYNKLVSSLSGDTESFFYGMGKTSSDPDRLDAFKDKLLSFDTASSWISDGGVIDQLCDVIKSIGSMGGIDSLSSALTNLNAQTVDNLKTVLHSLGDNELMGNIVLYNGLNKAISGLSVEGFDLSVTNVDFFYTADKQERNDELDCLLTFLECAMDPNYGLMKNGKIDASALSLDTVSVTYFLYPALTALSQSKVFATTKSGHESDFTFFEQVIAMVIKNSTLYGTITDENAALNAHTTVTLKSLIKGVSSWSDEIDNICYLIELLQSSPFGGISDLFDFNKLFEGSENEVASRIAFIKNVLLSVNDNALFYRALAPKIASAFESSFFQGGGTLGEAIDAADPYCMENALGTDYAAYTDFELTNLIDMANYIRTCKDVSFTDITKLPVEELTGAIDLMKHSYIFNKSGTSASSFQIILSRVIGQDALANYLYPTSGGEPTSPKDAYHKDKGDYSSVTTKADYIVKSMFTALSSAPSSYVADSEDELIIGETNSVKAVLLTFTNGSLSSIISGSSLNLDALTYDTFMTLLNALNDNPFFYDCVVNAIASVSTSSSFSVSEIDNSAADYYYTYNLSKTGSVISYTPASSDYMSNFAAEKYENTEIELLATVFISLKINKDAFGSFDAMKINPLIIKDLLTNLYYSRIFSGKINLAHVNTNLTDVNGDTYCLNDLTVFEQFINLIYDKAGLASMMCSSYYDSDYAVLYGVNASKVYLHNCVKSLNPDLWMDEIVNLTTDGKSYADPNDIVGLISASQYIFAGLGMDKISVNAETMKKLSPEKITLLLSSVNKVNVPGNLLSYSMESLLSSGDGSSAGIGLDKYSVASMPTSASIASNDDKNLIIASYGSIVTSSNVIYKFPLYETTGMKVISLSFEYASGSAGTGQMKIFEIYSSGGNRYVNRVDGDKVELISSTSLGVASCSHDIYVSFPSGVSIANCKMTADTAKYVLTHDEFSRDGGAIEAVASFLGSAYGPSGYFSFDGKSVEDFLNSHSTYGLIKLFCDSPYYLSFGFNASYELTATPSFYSRDLAFYNLTSVTTDMGGVDVTSSACENFNIDGNKEDHLIELASSFGKLDFGSGEDLYREAAWVDQAIANIGPVQAYNTVLSVALGQSANDYATTYLAAQELLLGDDGFSANFVANFKSVYFDYSISEYDPISPIIHAENDAYSYLGEKILSGQAKRFKDLANHYNVACSGVYVPTMVGNPLYAFALADRSNLTVSTTVSIDSLVVLPNTQTGPTELSRVFYGLADVYQIAKATRPSGGSGSASLKTLFESLDGYISLASSTYTKAMVSESYVAWVLNYISSKFLTRQADFYPSQDINNASSYYVGGMTYAKAYDVIYA